MILRGTLKKYPGYKQDKYLKFSKEKRNRLCAEMKASYEKAKSIKCRDVLYATGERKCVAGELLELHIELRKKDYEFICQI